MIESVYHFKQDIITDQAWSADEAERRGATKQLTLQTRAVESAPDSCCSFSSLCVYSAQGTRLYIAEVLTFLQILVKLREREVYRHTSLG